MARSGVLPCSLGVGVALATMIASGVGVGARQQTPAAPEKPRAPVLGVPPTPEDVEAWRRLWSGGDTPPPPPAPVAVPVAPVPAAKPTPVPGAVTPSVLDELYAAWTAGERDVLARRLGTPAAYEQVRPTLASTLDRWRTLWSRDRAVFTFDLALTAFAANWPGPGRLLIAARDLVTSRPDAPGVNADDDRFEALFHATAVSLLAALNVPRDVETYIDGISERVAIDPAATGGRLIAPRLLLARAMAREAQTRPIVLAAGDRRARRTWIVRGNDGDARRRLREVVDLLDPAARFPDTRAEALVRRAFIAHRLGDHDAALTMLVGVDTADDPLLDAWRLLIRGRGLAALGRADEALSAYEAAADIAPGAQTPAVALAALHLRAGNRDAAVEWAERARTAPADETDPWPVYWTGESRFLRARVDQLRGTPR